MLRKMRRFAVQGTFLIILSYTLVGCIKTSPVVSEEMSEILFVPVKSTEGFLKHWTVGTKSAWFNPKTNEVLLSDTSTQELMKIVGLPEGYGNVIATGWEDNQRFFIHYSKASDSGTTVYLDLEKRIITETKHWGSW